MRTIKFRLYLQHDETGMITTKTFSYAEIFSGEAIRELETTYLRWAVIGKSQFTGLLDKNGKEIYEGDLIKVLDRDWSDVEKDTKVLTVYYRNDRYILINKAGIEESENSEPNIYNQEWYEIALFRKHGRDRFEIIGNIYENPELTNPL